MFHIFLMPFVCVSNCGHGAWSRLELAHVYVPGHGPGPGRCLCALAAYSHSPHSEPRATSHTCTTICNMPMPTAVPCCLWPLALGCIPCGLAGACGTVWVVCGFVFCGRRGSFFTPLFPAFAFGSCPAAGMRSGRLAGRWFLLWFLVDWFVRSLFVVRRVVRCSKSALNRL